MLTKMPFEALLFWAGGTPEKDPSLVSPRCRGDPPPPLFLGQLTFSDFSALKTLDSPKTPPPLLLSGRPGEAHLERRRPQALPHPLTPVPTSHPGAATDSAARCSWCPPGSSPSSASRPAAACSRSTETPAACPPPRRVLQPPRVASPLHRPPTRPRSRSSTCLPTSAAAGDGPNLPRAACPTERSRPTCPCHRHTHS